MWCSGGSSTSGEIGFGIRWLPQILFRFQFWQGYIRPRPNMRFFLNLLSAWQCSCLKAKVLRDTASTFC